MSGFFGNEDNAVEKLKRAGIAADKTIFTAPDRHADDATAQARQVLFHPPGRRHDPPTPNQTVGDRGPKPDEEEKMRTSELDKDLKRELERLKGKGEGDEEALRRLGIEQLKRKLPRDWERRLRFDPRPLRDE